MAALTDHVDETGQPCTRHPHVGEQRIYELATLGSRMPAFHHDAASKLQSLMMALDEISELGADNVELRTPIDTAHAALRELNQILAANRALAKAPQRARIALPELLMTAANGTGVRMRTQIQAKDVRVAAPAVKHALALVLDVAAGPSHLGRAVDVTCALEGSSYVVTISGPPEASAKLASNAGEALAIATYVIAREQGELRCTPTAFVVSLPAAIDPTGAMEPLPKP